MNETSSGLPGPVKSTSGSEDIQLPIVMYYIVTFLALSGHICV